MTTLFIISAPSGSGKSTLVEMLRKLVEGLDFSVSYTTRPPRGSEQNRREYYFVPRPEFEAMVARGEFLEHADVFGNYYGTARRFLDEAQRKGPRLPARHRRAGGIADPEVHPGRGQYLRVAAQSRKSGVETTPSRDRFRGSRSAAAWTPPVGRLRITKSTTIF